MIEKIAYLCAIMAAVNSRSTFYGTSILDTILPSDISLRLPSQNTSTADSAITKSDEWKYIAVHKLLESIRRTIHSKKSITNHESSPEHKVRSSLPNSQFNTFFHDDEDMQHVSSNSMPEISNRLFHSSITGNETINRFLKVSKSVLSRGLIQHGMPGLAAFEYHH